MPADARQVCLERIDRRLIHDLIVHTFDRDVN